jgi:hypothetical protein
MKTTSHKPNLGLDPLARLERDLAAVFDPNCRHSWLSKRQGLSVYRCLDLKTPNRTRIRY